ncbi:hypothetical protein N657DRAFT_640003 [Parathielavia appendiculata]|uniref:Uncharacterized protein n=1 Tax=Parathielavia appendiculata TaxID=2587402 RepID=A0AAN6UAC9_9PEZI|nr:hypothetical protein N657DRAFT_640003 [Parathielavia appendiculata]
MMSKNRIKPSQILPSQFVIHQYHSPGLSTKISGRTRPFSSSPKRMAAALPMQYYTWDRESRFRRIRYLRGFPTTQAPVIHPEMPSHFAHIVTVIQRSMGDQGLPSISISWSPNDPNLLSTSWMSLPRHSVFLGPETRLGRSEGAASAPPHFKMTSSGVRSYMISVPVRNAWGRPATELRRNGSNLGAAQEKQNGD